MIYKLQHILYIASYVISTIKYTYVFASLCITRQIQGTVLQGGAIVTEVGAQARQESTQALRIPDQLDQNRHKTEMIAITDKWVTPKKRRTKFNLKFCIEHKEDEQRKAEVERSSPFTGGPGCPAWLPSCSPNPPFIFLAKLSKNISFNP